MSIFNYNNSSKIFSIFEECKKKSIESSMRSKHSACLVKNNKIIVLENNKYNKKNYCYSDHAEICVFKKMEKLIKSNKIKKGIYKLYIIRYSQTNGFMHSKPCKYCVKIIKNMPYVNKVYYSNDNITYICENKNNIKTNHVSVGFTNKWN